MQFGSGATHRVRWRVLYRRLSIVAPASAEREIGRCSELRRSGGLGAARQGRLPPFDTVPISEQLRTESDYAARRISPTIGPFHSVTIPLGDANAPGTDTSHSVHPEESRRWLSTGYGAAPAIELHQSPQQSGITAK